MITFSNILFPVDLSPQSRAAVPFVRAMAKRFHAPVTALHVLEIPPPWFGPPELIPFEAFVDTPRLLEDRRHTLSAFLADGFIGVAIEGCVQQGDPAAVITRIAHQKHSSLVMMPTHGYGVIRSLLLGSVTAKVLHDAECPVWTAGRLDAMKTDPEQPWREILCAISADARDVPLLRWAAQFAEEQSAPLRLVHGVGGFEPEPKYAEEDPLRDFLFGVAEERIAKLQKEAGTNLEVSMEAGSAARVVREIALQRHADLLIVGRGLIQKPLGRLRSNDYAIIRDAPCPVISI
jgi:nucleotide-binding universal stress UspA family protein